MVGQGSSKSPELVQIETLNPVSPITLHLLVLTVRLVALSSLQLVTVVKAFRLESFGESLLEPLPSVAPLCEQAVPLIMWARRHPIRDHLFHFATFFLVLSENCLRCEWRSCRKSQGSSGSVFM